MKKIVFFHHSGDIGGAGISLMNTISMLVNDYKIIVYTEDGPIVNKLSEKGCNIKKYRNSLGTIPSYSGGPKIYSRTYWKQIIRIKKSVKEIQEIIYLEKPDIIVTNSITTSYITGIAHNLHIPIVSFVRETKRKDIGNFVNEYLLRKNSTQIVFITEYDKKTYNICHRKQPVIYNSIDLSETNIRKISKYDACKQLNISPDFFNVLYLGGDSVIKGWKLMKQIITRQLPNIQFIIAGSCKDKVLSSGAAYIGVQKELNLCMSSADVLVFPVVSPHQGRPIFEAGAYNLPVIVPEYEVFEEAVKSNINGVFFRPLDVDDFAEKIIYVSKHPDIAKKLGIQNRKMTEGHHSYRKNKIKMLDIFKKL